jgi:hypothetical protein
MELKLYQQKVLERFSEYLTTLADKQAEAQAFVDFQRTRGRTVASPNWCAETWDALNAAGRLPLLQQRGNTTLAPYIHYVDGCGDPIPNVCLKVPTGGGKTGRDRARQGATRRRPEPVVRVSWRDTTLSLKQHASRCLRRSSVRARP